MTCTGHERGSSGRRVVRRGYDRVAAAYLETRRPTTPDVALVARLAERLPAGAAVLDAGCGAGFPITARLAADFKVTGVDFSMAQLRLARAALPDTSFTCQDLVHLGFADGTFDAICSYYAIIHVPRRLHAGLLADFHRLLTPGGHVLLCLGANDLPESVSGDYFGTEMYWSHYDAAANRRLVRGAGFVELWSGLVPDVGFDGAEHLFVLARKAPSTREPVD